MNPTDEVDDLLTRSGARWRADQPSPPEPDLEQLLGGRRPRRWVPALAAASVAVIAAAALTVLPDGDGKPTGGSSQSFAQGNQAPYDELLVRDGDQVRVSGQVIAAPGQDPLFCAPVPRLTDPGWAKGAESAPTCPAQYAVTLKNLDLAKLVQVTKTKGVTSGYAVLTGIWSGRTIDVREQTRPEVRSTTLEQTIPPDLVPCPAPAGGWKPGQINVDKAAVVKFLEGRQDQATDPRVLYPNGHAPGAPEVYTIGLAHGDVAAFRTAFEKVYEGNLCVHQVKFSETELTQLGTAVSDLIPKGLGVYAAGGASEEDKVNVSALVYDEALRTALTPIGLDDLNLEVAVKPVR
ncbi:hypothetical protein AB0E63_15615 [Kribbella sp. NPDC026596]|uniref:hypothetical protein n=1 Tax=Kribbella sp. NPDC026596 TaxID=3155122 RepID=UPI003401B8CA